MTKMFDKFDNQPEDYIPDNMHKKPVNVLMAVENNPLEKTKDGYLWHYGDAVEIPVTVNIDITIEADAWYTDQEGAKPSETPQPGVQYEAGQRFYNLTDIKSWTLLYADMGIQKLIWKEDTEFLYPSLGQQTVTLTPSMQDKFIVCTLCNFRLEQIKQFVRKDFNEMSVVIDKEFSKTLLPGIYYLYTGVEGEESQCFSARHQITIL